jgi:hypothetical protein
MTIPNTARKAGPLLGTGSQTAWPFTFKVFAASDVAVTIADSTGAETVLALGTDFTVALNSNQETSPGGTVTYPISGSPLPVGSVLAIVGDLDYDQGLDIPSGGNFSPLALENQLDRTTMQIQQLKEEIDRAAKLPTTSSESAEALVDDLQRIADSADNLDIVAANIADIITVADDLNEPVSEINTVAGAITNVNAVGSNIANVNTVAGISANVTSVAGNATNINAVAGNSSNITAVAGNATNINAVAANGADIDTVSANIASVNSAASNMAAIIAAPSQAAAAAASAAAAAASVASGMYSAVQDKSANYTVVAGDAGDLIRVTTTGGAVTITLPLISTQVDGFKVAIVKWTGDTNQVTIARSGSDTINGTTSATIGSQYTSTTFVADFETSQWLAVTSGLGSTNVVVDRFTGNGSTTAFTLSGSPGSVNNTYVFVGGVYQQKNIYSLAGTTLTFSAAPPSGTNNIEVVWTQPMAVGVPSDATVTPAKLSSGALSWDTPGAPGVALQVGDATQATREVRTSTLDGTAQGGFLRGYRAGSPSFYVGDDAPISGGSGGGLAVFAYGANPVKFYTNGVERAQIDSAGRIGIGIVPSAWSYTAAQVSFLNFYHLSNYQGGMVRGAFFNGSNWIAQNSFMGMTRYYMDEDNHIWQLASGVTSGGTVTWKNAFKIATDGQQSSVIPGGTTLYNEYKCRAWVNFNGTGTVAIRASGNVTSITDNGTGDYTVNLTTAMPDANYEVNASISPSYGVGNAAAINMFSSGLTEQAPTTTAFRFSCSPEAGGFFDPKYVSLSIFR